MFGQGIYTYGVSSPSHNNAQRVLDAALELWRNERQGRGASTYKYMSWYFNSSYRTPKGVVNGAQMPSVNTWQKQDAHVQQRTAGTDDAGAKRQKLNPDSELISLWCAVTGTFHFCKER